MAKSQRLELTWIGKENRPRLEPRILLEDPEKSYHANDDNEAHYLKVLCDEIFGRRNFVAETSETIYILEPKMHKEMEDANVLAKKDTAVQWCANASNHALSNGGKPWRYLLIPHDEIGEKGDRFIFA